KLCVTRGGYLGLVPDSARIGDEVWIVPGVRTPLILRYKGVDLDHGEQRFQKVGAAYIHGIMQGEGVAQ
ncbi:hypothetical protein QBC38DRAFT_525501, partial [Podospora fimiseda]